MFSVIWFACSLDENITRTCFIFERQCRIAFFFLKWRHFALLLGARLAKQTSIIERITIHINNNNSLVKYRTISGRQPSGLTSVWRHHWRRPKRTAAASFFDDVISTGSDAVYAVMLCTWWRQCRHLSFKNQALRVAPWFVIWFWNSSNFKLSLKCLLFLRGSLWLSTLKRPVKYNSRIENTASVNVNVSVNVSVNVEWLRVWNKKPAIDYSRSLLKIPINSLRRSSYSYL